MRQAARSTDTAAHAGHALDKVVWQHALRGFQQRYPAGLDTVAGNRVVHVVFVQPLLLQPLHHRVGQPAASRKDAPIVGGVIQHALVQRGDVEVTAVKQRLQLLLRKKEAVQVAAVDTQNVFVKHRVDVVRAAFERTAADAAILKQYPRCSHRSGRR